MEIVKVFKVVFQGFVDSLGSGGDYWVCKGVFVILLIDLVEVVGVLRLLSQFYM